MVWKEELNNIKKALKNGTGREKFEYFWEYYKWHLVIIIFVAWMFGDIIYSNVTAKDCVLRGIFLNVTNYEDKGTELEQNFLKTSPIDAEREKIIFDTNLYYSTDYNSSMAANSYETLQVLMVNITAGKIDFIIGELESMNNLAYNQLFCELSDVLSEEQMETYEQYFCYYDRAFIEELRDMDIMMDDSATLVYPNPQMEYLMKEPAAVFINVSECEKLKNIYPNMEGDYFMAFAVNSINSEKAIEFLEFIME